MFDCLRGVCQLYLKKIPNILLSVNEHVRGLAEEEEKKKKKEEEEEEKKKMKKKRS